MVDPFAGVTAAVDITDFLAALDGRPFFLSLLYAVTRAANRVPQLRRRILDGRVVEYDWCSPSYTLMKPDGVYVYSLIEGERTYGDFIAEGQRQQTLSLDRRTLTEDGDRWGTSSSRACRGSTICRSSTPSSPRTTAIPASAGAAIPSAAAA